MSELANRFDRLWDGDSPPDVFAFLEQYGSVDPSEKLEILLRDQHRRWSTESPLSVEEYLNRIPELNMNLDWKCNLAMGEYRARQGGRDLFKMEEFLTRFPDISERLKSRLSEVATDGYVHENTSLALTKVFERTPLIDRASYGRYVVSRVLGEGAFGRVYLGYDEQLRRQVAIKVPSTERIRDSKDAEKFLHEAQMVASLDHPHIVPVHDVGRTDEGVVYVVSKYIKGRTLRDFIRNDQPSPQDIAAMMVTLVRALQHSHDRRLVHRDIKPGNILLEDETGKAYLADFGLAVRDEDYIDSAHIAGTPCYMSPEQARGEGHRLDGRSDIFSLGVVFYEVLVGERPFIGKTNNELLYQISSIDPPSPSEIDDAIPAELSRICLKALAKRSSDRYANAEEMAIDLLDWQQIPNEHQDPTQKTIVPRGLRSFDSEDADYFLDLLPGPWNRNGLPESVQFWKTRMEETDPDQTFSAGIIYGPSGCGKSSLVKAGLLPRLCKHVVSIYVEATPTETEKRILRHIGKHFPEIVDENDLVKTFTKLRQQEERKVVLVIDQFEQWLHCNPIEVTGELIGALRQCDGGSLQTVVMVRDDFAMPAARFMDAIEIPIIQGENFATIDLFDEDHAIKLLHRFGQAFGKLPSEKAELSIEQEQFLTQAVSDLAQNGKVVSVQLSLFAEMIKSKPWSAGILQEVGGTEGVGVSFLEETFSGRSSNPKHLQHADASRKVLKALLPDRGSDIKGHMKSHEELLAISGYQSNPGSFGELLRILDGELRLITPTDPSGAHSNNGSNFTSKHYQLTHDYLVPSLRVWLTRKATETRRGRAALRLDESVSLWQRDKQTRFLPGIGEYLSIQSAVDRKLLTGPQREMLRKATSFYAIRASLIVCVLAMLFFVGRNWARSQSTAEVVRSLATAETSDVPTIVHKLQQRRRWADPLLIEMIESSPADSKERLHASLAMLPVDSSQSEFLFERLLGADVSELVVICNSLADQKHQLTDRLWTQLDDSQSESDRRFNAALALAAFDPPTDTNDDENRTEDDEKWHRHAPFLTDQLIASSLGNPSLYGSLTKIVAPARSILHEPLVASYSSADATPQRSMATAMLITFFRDSPSVLSELLLNAQLDQISAFSPLLDQQRELLMPILQKELAKADTLHPDSKMRFDIKEASRIALAGAALIRFDDRSGAWDLFADSAESNVRSFLIHRLKPIGVKVETLIDQLDRQHNASTRNALIQTLGEFDLESISAEQRERALAKVRRFYREDPDSGLHATAEWLLRRWGDDSQLIQERFQLETGDPTWRVDGQGHTMVVVDLTDHSSFRRRIEIATKEVDIAQFRRFMVDFKTSQPNDDHHPVGSLTWFDAIGYCRWLSEQEGIAEDQMCYPLQSFQGEEVDPYPDYVQRTGYRLPTGREWEIASLTVSSRDVYSLRSRDLFARYAWTPENTSTLMPTGLLKPNGIGLFDMCGNVREWCSNRRSEDRETRGGAYSSDAASDWQSKQYFVGTTHFRSIGFRVARTLE